MWFLCKVNYCCNTFSNQLKFIVKVMAVVTIILYASLILCQKNVNGYQHLKQFSNVLLNGIDETSSVGSAKVNSVSKVRNLKLRETTATPKPPTTELNDIFISVKTTKSNHDNRLEVILNTWHHLAKEQTWFFTDAEDKYYQERSNNHLINTNCSNGHFRRALCCKMSVELDMFLESGKKWFCHFDDDNYVNIPRLIDLLSEYSPAMEWYLGKPSVASPLEIHLEYKRRKSSDAKVKFWFATGGAGFCISRALTMKMIPITGGGKLISIGDRIRFPDDVTVGFIIEHLLRVPLTVIEQFHSHLEQMEYIAVDSFQDQVSFSYGHKNIIKIDGFDHKSDPTRFRSLHCHLFPFFKFCSR